jgi:hypothetical protein
MTGCDKGEEQLEARRKDDKNNEQTRSNARAEEQSKRTHNSTSSMAEPSRYLSGRARASSRCRMARSVLGMFAWNLSGPRSVANSSTKL